MNNNGNNANNANDDRDISPLASQFEKTLAGAMDRFQTFSCADLLDLMDHYSLLGRDFEADMCQRIVQRLYPDDTDAKLARAHSLADEGNWEMAAKVANGTPGTGEFTAYDLALFNVEKFLRQALPAKAQNVVDLSLPDTFGLAECDFLFDSAAIFRDYGYCDRTLSLLSRISTDYEDYRQVLELKADTLIAEGSYRDAAELLDRMIDDNPFDKSLWSRMAQCRMNMGNTPAAVDAAQNALAIGRDIEASRIVGYAEAVSGKFDDFGFYNYLLANSIPVQDYMLHLDLALHYARHGHHHDAIQALSLAGMYCPRGSRHREVIVALMALSLINTGNTAAALENLHSLRAIATNYGLYFIEAARLLLSLGQQAQALSLMLSAASEYHAAAARLALISAILTTHNLYSQARPLWEKIILNSSSLPADAQRQAATAAEKLGLT